jgi:hypothetical protein
VFRHDQGSPPDRMRAAGGGVRVGAGLFGGEAVDGRSIGLQKVIMMSVRKGSCCIHEP